MISAIGTSSVDWHKMCEAEAGGPRPFADAILSPQYSVQDFRRFEPTFHLVDMG